MSVRGKSIIKGCAVGIDEGLGVDRTSAHALERAMECCLLLLLGVFAAPFVLFAAATLLTRHAGCRLLRHRPVKGDMWLGLMLLIVGVVGFVGEVGVVTLMQRWGALATKNGAWMVTTFGTLRIGMWAFVLMMALQAGPLTINTWRMRRHAGTLRAARASIRFRRGLGFVAAACTVMAMLVYVYWRLQGLTPGWPWFVAFGL